MGLLGEIDLDQAKDGVIICKDGFKAVIYTPKDLKKIGYLSGCEYEIQEVDESSISLIIHKK